MHMPSPGRACLGQDTSKSPAPLAGIQGISEQQQSDLNTKGQKLNSEWEQKLPGTKPAEMGTEDKNNLFQKKQDEELERNSSLGLTGQEK